MDSKAMWIGGTLAALAMGFGGVLLATGGAVQVQPAIAVDEQVLEASPAEVAGPDASEAADAAPQMVSTPVVQETPPASTPAADKPASPAKADSFVIKRILPIEGPIKYGEWHWDASDAPAGPLVVTVDLDARVISVFRGGYEIGTAAVMLGTDKHPTPLGTFPILWKQRHNVSEKYNNAPMPWSLFLTNDGIAIHGGSTVENGYASHGCIAVPDELAQRLFAAASKGDKVIITRGKMIGVGDRII